MYTIDNLCLDQEQAIEIPQVIFNHDIMTCTDESVVGNYLYSGRALGLTNSDDIIQLHPDLESQWHYIVEHYARIELEHTDQVIWNVNFDTLANYSEYDVSVFIFDEHVNKTRPNTQFLDTVNALNSKNSFMKIANQLSIPVPHTFCYQSKNDIYDFSSYSYPCYAKAAISVSGAGIYRCENSEKLAWALDQFDETVPLQIQEEIQAKVFLNMQYEITDEGAKPYAITEQILQGYVHQGNCYASEYEKSWQYFNPLAEWMYEQGMKGIFAFDVAVVEESQSNQLGFVAIECNPRFNGASYPTAIAKKLNLSQWCSQMTMTKYRSLKQIDLTDIEYSPSTGKGIIIVNWGSILAGKLGIMIAADTISEQNKFKQQLKERIT
jgi:hypothetical protein